MRFTLTTSVRLKRLGPQSMRALRGILLGPRTRDLTKRNIWYYYLEIVWAGVLAAAAAFNAAFAVRLGASNAMVGWLTSLPCLIATVMLVPAARFLETRSDRMPWVAGSLLVTRLGYGMLAVLPWLIHSHRAEAVVALLIVMTVPGTFFNAGWNPLLADTIPPEERTRVFARRNILYSATIAGLTLLAGKWLEASDRLRWAGFPLNYQLLYAVGFAGAILSTVYVWQIKVPAGKAVARPSLPGPAKPFLAELRTMFALDRNFRAITGNTLLFDSGAWLVGPLYVIFFVRELGASDVWIGLNSTLANVGVIVGYWLWRRALRRLGYSRGLLLSAPLGACYAFLVALFPNLTLILAWGVVINLINPGLSLSHFNILLQLCPAERRPTYIATFSTIMNAAAFVLPMVGVAMAGVLGIRTVLLVGGCIRLAGAVLFHANRIVVPEVDIH